MHPRPAAIATALLIAAFALLLSSPAHPLEGVTASRADEMSSASRKRAKRYVEPAPYYVVQRRYSADPSIGPDGRPYQRPAHLVGCVYDEGYGRFSACPHR